MSYFITKKKLFIALCIIAALWALSTLIGCGAGLRPPGPEKELHGGPSGALASLAVWAAWIAGAGLLVCGVVAFFRPSAQIAKLTLCCVSMLITAGILHWVSTHWAILLGLCVSVLVLSGAAWTYINRKALEKKTGIDLNRDGRIGT